MSRFINIFDIVKSQGLLPGFFGTYIWIIILILAAINCFLGFKFRKLGALGAGFFAGLMAGLTLGCKMGNATSLTLVIAVVIGIICGIILLILTRIGFYIMSVLYTFVFLFELLPWNTTLATILYLAVSAGVCVFMFVKPRFTLCITTGLGGGFGCAWAAAHLFGLAVSWYIMVMMLLFAAPGILFQLKPWQEPKERARKAAAKRKHHKARTRDEEEAEDDDPAYESEENYLAELHARRLKEQRKTQQEERAKLERLRQKQSRQRRLSSVDTNPRRPGYQQTRNDYQSYRAQTRNPAAPPSQNPYSAQNPYMNQSSGQSSQYTYRGNTGSLPSYRDVQRNTPTGVDDMSDIRLHLSREVTKLYRQEQEDN